MAENRKKLVNILLILIFMNKQASIFAEQYAKDNGNIYVKNDGKENSNNNVDLDAVISMCNSSFSIPMDYITQFNSTGELPNTIDKTGQCYMRCFYEKAGLIDNWKLNTDRIRQLMWPATGDSIEVCQEEGKNETNACVRTYAIAKCLTKRAIVDARSSIHK